MQISVDWPEIYASVVSGAMGDDKGAFVAARRIESDILNENWQVGEVFADRAKLAARYGLGRGTLTEAVRILEDRGVAKMKRGPRGGLVVMPVPLSTAISGVVNHLRLCAMTPGQFREARVALSIIASYARACREGEEARDLFCQTYTAALAAAPFSDPLRSYANCKRTARASISDPLPVRLFFSCLNQSAGAAAEDGAAADGDGSKDSLARQVARTLALELAAPRADGSLKIGTESELCERFGISRLVMRQAVRVLEGHGVIESQRCRSHGLMAGTPKPTAVIELVVAFFSSMGLSAEDIEPCRHMLGRLTHLLALAKATSAQRARFQQLARHGELRSNPSGFREWIELDLAISDNPALTVMARALTGYRARLGAHTRVAFDDDSEVVDRGLRNHVAAVARGDVAAADRFFGDILRGASASSRPA
jgi:DNA-binding FadR family transcriptional regulator